MISFTLITVFNVVFDLSIWTNMVIAFATCLATAIHIDSQIKLKKNRVWEVNKSILLELSNVLAQVVEDLKKANDYYFDEMQGIEQETGITYDYPESLYKQFSTNTFEVLNVYKPIMSPELIKSIEHLNNDITNSVNEGEINTFEAYDKILFEHEILQVKLNNFIKKVAGIEYS